MSLRRLSAVFLSVVGALLLAIVLYLAFGDLGRHKGRIEAFVTEQVGRPFAIDGALGLEVLPAVSVHAEQVRLGNAEWGSKPQMVEIGRLSANIGLWSLISGPVDIRSFELSDVSVLLEKNAQGEGNWVFGAPDASAAETEADSPAAAATKVPALIQHGKLSNVRVTYREPRTPDRVVLLEALTIEPGSADLPVISGKGKLDDYAVSLNGELGPLGALVSGRDIRMALEGAVGNLRFEAKGSLGRLDPLDGADLTLKLENPDLGVMLKNLHLPVFATGPLAVDARLKDAGELTRLDVDARIGAITAKVDGTLRTFGLPGSDFRFAIATRSLRELQQGLPKIPASVSGGLAAGGNKIAVQGLKARIGESEIAGRANMTQARGRQRFDVELASRRLDLTPFLEQDASARPKKEARKKFVFDEEPLPLDSLKGVDARLRLVAAEVKLGAESLKDVESTLNIGGGRLALEGRAKDGIEGALESKLTLSPTRAAAADLNLEVGARNMRVGAPKGLSDRREVPGTNVEMRLVASGGSARQMAAGANGRVLVTQGPGKMEGDLLGMFGGDIFGELAGRLNPFAAKDPYTQLECTVARVDIVDGQATVKPVLIQSQKVTVIADGRIDLRTEGLAVAFNTRPRAGVGISPGMFTNPFIELAGTLASPRVGVGAKGVTAGAAAAATGGLSVLAQGLLDRAKGQEDLCKPTLAEAIGAAK